MDIGGREGRAITRRDQVTEEVIRNAMEGCAAFLAAGRRGVSSEGAALQHYVDRLLSGETAPAIKIDGNMIVDGNHRHIAGRILGREPPVIQWLGGRPGNAVPWADLPISPEAW